MAAQVWSWLLMSVGVTGMYLAGRKLWIGWAIGLGSQVLWLAYSIATRQWGFLVSCFIYGAVQLRNLIVWRRQPVLDTSIDYAKKKKERR
jgi:hypothetical protein